MIGMTSIIIVVTMIGIKNSTNLIVLTMLMNKMLRMIQILTKHM